MSGLKGPKGECIREETAKKILEQRSNEAVKNLTQAVGDPEAQVQAQEDLAKIQEHRVEQAVKDTEDIKALLQIRRDSEDSGASEEAPVGDRR